MATGYTGTWSNGAFTVRFYWSSSFNSSTRKSTVTVVPQIYNTVNWGGELYACSYAISGGGIYINGSLDYAFDGNWGYESNLRCPANVNEWTNFPPYSGSISQITVDHDDNGVGSFTLGFYGTIVPQYSEGTRTVVGDNTSASFKTVTITEAKKTYTISYNKGSYGTGTNTTATKTYGVALTLKGAIFTRTGYTQDGWSTSDGGAKVYNLGGTYTANQAATLYPHWEKKSYTLSINPGLYSTVTVKRNGTSLSDGATVYYNDQLVITFTAPTGYRLATHTVNGSTFTSGNTYTVPELGSSTLSVICTCYENSYTIHFDKNADSATGTMSDMATCYYDNVYTLTSNAFSRTGYTFKNWNTAANGSGTTYNNGTSVTKLSSVNGATVTLYAQWQINSYTVSYNANGHGTAPASQSGNYNSTITLKAFIGNQSAAGTTSSYTITGNANGGSWSGSNGTATRTPNYTYKQTEWNTASGGGGTSYASKGSYTFSASNRTLYAIWSTSTSYSYTYAVPSGTPTKNQSVTVSFDADGGGSPSAKTSTRKMTFSGWYTAAAGGTKRTGSSQVSQSETVYAHYSDGTSAYPAITLPTVSKTGYTFSGWYTASSGGTRVGGAGSSYVPTADITLYAHWAVIEYKLTTSVSTSGITLTVDRTSSPISGSTGSIVSGATLYTGDVLAISYTLGAGKQIDTATVNGQSFTDSVPVTVSGDVSVVATVKSSAIVKIYHDGAWQDYQIYIYSNGAWEQYQAYIYDGSQWVPY